MLIFGIVGCGGTQPSLSAPEFCQCVVPTSLHVKDLLKPHDLVAEIPGPSLSQDAAGRCFCYQVEILKEADNPVVLATRRVLAKLKPA